MSGSESGSDELQGGGQVSVGLNVGGADMSCQGEGAMGLTCYVKGRD